MRKIRSHSIDEMDFEQYYEDWRHRDSLTWHAITLLLLLGGGMVIGAHFAKMPWYVVGSIFGFCAFFLATITIVLARNLYYQWRDLRHIEDLAKRKRSRRKRVKALESRPIPPKVKEEEKKKKLLDKLRRIGVGRMGSTLLLVNFIILLSILEYIFYETWQWCSFYDIIGSIIMFIPFLPFIWFFYWLKWKI